MNKQKDVGRSVKWCGSVNGRKLVLAGLQPVEMGPLAGDIANPRDHFYDSKGEVVIYGAWMIE